MKKSSIIVASALLGTALYGNSLVAHADTDTTAPTVPVKENTDQTQPYSAANQASKTMAQPVQNTREGGPAEQVLTVKPQAAAPAVNDNKAAAKQSWQTTINYQWSTTDDPKNPTYHGLPASYAGKSPYKQNTVITLTPTVGADGKPAGVKMSQDGTKVNLSPLKDLGEIQGTGQKIDSNITLDAGKTYHKYQVDIISL